MSIKIKIKTCPHCGQLLLPDKCGNLFVDVCNKETADISHWFGIEKRIVIALSEIKSAFGLSDEELFEAVNEYKYAADFYFSLLSNSRKIAVRFEKRAELLKKKNKKLREALENIKNKAELVKSEASNATYGFAYEIEELAREALKGGKE